MKAIDCYSTIYAAAKTNAAHEFTSRSIANTTGKTTSEISAALNPLGKAGLIEQCGKGPNGFLYRISASMVVPREAQRRLTAMWKSRGKTAAKIARSASPHIVVLGKKFTIAEARELHAALGELFNGG